MMLCTCTCTGVPRLEREAAILEERGVPGLRGYLRDLHDDPKPTFKLKLLLAGPSMAGKSSLARALMGEARRLTDAVTERTIGLEIVRFVLPDPRGRALAGVEFIACELAPPASLRASASICCCARTCGSVGAPADWVADYIPVLPCVTTQMMRVGIMSTLRCTR